MHSKSTTFSRRDLLIALASVAAAAGCSGGSALAPAVSRAPGAAAGGAAAALGPFAGMLRPSFGRGAPRFSTERLAPQAVATGTYPDPDVYLNAAACYLNSYDPNDGSFAAQLDWSQRDANGNVLFTVTDSAGEQSTTTIPDVSQFPQGQSTAIGAMTVLNQNGMTTVTVANPNDTSHPLVMTGTYASGAAQIDIGDGSGAHAIPLGGSAPSSADRRAPQYWGDANCWAVIIALLLVVLALIALLIWCGLACATFLRSLATLGGKIGIRAAAGNPTLTGGAQKILIAIIGALSAILAAISAGLATQLAAACGPSPTPTPTSTPTATPSPTATPTATSTPTAKPTATATPANSPSPGTSPTGTAKPVATPTSATACPQTAQPAGTRRFGNKYAPC